MLEIKETSTSNENYLFVETLMQTAFPVQERRNNNEQRKNTDTNPLFHCNIIFHKHQPIGIINYWEFEKFRYVEHFAIKEEFRNKGYGKATLAILKKQTTLPWVLEVEEPVDEITNKRISFYQKEGFIYHEIPYLQPPYREEDSWFQLKLMTYGSIDMTIQFEEIRNTIYREVYQQII